MPAKNRKSSRKQKAQTPRREARIVAASSISDNPDFTSAVRSSQQFTRERATEFRKWAPVATEQAEQGLAALNSRYRENGQPDSAQFCSDVQPVIRDFAAETAKWLDIVHRVASDACDAVQVPVTERMSTISNIIRDEFQLCHIGLMEPIRGFGHDLGVQLSGDNRWSELQRPLLDVAMAVNGGLIEDLKQGIPESADMKPIERRFEAERAANLRFDGINLRIADVVARFVSEFQADADLYLASVQSKEDLPEAEAQLSRLQSTMLDAFRNQFGMRDSESAALVKDLRTQLVEILLSWKSEAAAKFEATIVGKNILRLRKECGWSYDVLAEKTGMSKPLIIGHVKHRKGVAPNNLALYARAFSEHLGRSVTVVELETLPPSE